MKEWVKRDEFMHASYQPHGFLRSDDSDSSELPASGPNAGLVAAVVIIGLFMTVVIILSIRKTLTECCQNVAVVSTRLQRQRNP